MTDFRVETGSISAKDIKKKELVLQIKSLQRFYADMGINSPNIQRIFNLVTDYLEAKIDKLVIKAFFDTLVYQNKLETDKELDLLVTFDQLLDGIEEDFHKSDYQSAYYGMQIDHELYQEAA